MFHRDGKAWPNRFSKAAKMHRSCMFHEQCIRWSTEFLSRHHCQSVQSGPRSLARRWGLFATLCKKLWALTRDFFSVLSYLVFWGSPLEFFHHLQHPLGGKSKKKMLGENFCKKIRFLNSCATKKVGADRTRHWGSYSPLQQNPPRPSLEDGWENFFVLFDFIMVIFQRHFFDHTLHLWTLCT